MTVDEAQAFMDKYESIIKEPELRVRTRLAIELHHKMDKSWDDSGPEVRAIIKELKDRLLVDVFKVDEETRKRFNEKEL